MKRLSNVLGRRGLMSTRVNHLALRVERPEGVTEQVARVVHLLDLDQARPVFTETAFRSFGWLVTAEELLKGIRSVSSPSNDEDAARDTYARVWAAKLNWFQGIANPLQKTCQLSTSSASINGFSHLLRRCDASIVVNPHLPLMKSSNSERSLPLSFRDAAILKVSHSASGQLKEPC